MRLTTIIQSLFAALLFTIAPLLAQQQDKNRFQLPPEIKEVSGLYRASVDSMWWHNDSGDGPNIFLTNGRGELLDKRTLSPAQAKDWEDMTADDKGHIYVGDFGDNRFQRGDLSIYRYHLETEKVDSILFDYPNNEHYNVEAFFWYNDAFHLFTKSRMHKKPLPTYHFVIPATPGNYTAVLRDSFYIKKRVVTAAAVHPSSGRMVLLAYYYTKRLGFIPYSAANIYCFSDYPEGHFLDGKMQKKRISGILATQYESIDFINPDRVWVASEQTLFIKPKAKKVRWKE